MNNQASGYLTYAKAPVMEMAAMNSAPSFSEKSFSDFHLYTLSQPVTLN